MKYLKFYEAFKSKGISNTLKFLKEKIGKSSSNNFIHALRQFMTTIDFPIDRISDSDIKYMSAKKAVNLRNTEKVTNNRGIWVLKFWFSLEKGYLGFTATGNVEKEISYSEHGLRDAEKFSDSDMNFIKNHITRTGEIWPVTDYRKLQTGQTVIGQFDSYSQDKIAFAKIFIDERDDNRTYAIQNVSEGSAVTDRNWVNFQQFGNLSWWLFDNSEMGHDHRKLHFFRPSSEELLYIEPPKEEKKVQKEEDPLSWNLPLNTDFSFGSWTSRSKFSIDNSKKIKDSDFALVLYFDDMINPDSDALFYEKPSDTRQERREEKSGATKLLSDEQIKRMNIERYVQKLSASLDISETEFYNLEKIVNKFLAKEFSYLSILRNRPDWSELSAYIDNFYKIVDSEPEDKRYYIQRIKNVYANDTKKYYEYLLKYQEAKNLITGKSQLKMIFDELFNLGTLINKKLTENEINSIDDLFKIRSLMRTIYDFIRQNRNQLSYQVREVISGFSYISEIEFYFKSNENSYEHYNNDLQIIKRIENFVKSL